MAKILIIEDDTNIRTGLVDALELAGHQAFSAADATLGLREYNLHKPDLILLDIMMPGISGYDLCRQIRRSDPTTLIIMLTAKSEEIDKVLGLEFGADDYVTKPFSIRELTARINARLRRRSAEEAAEAESRFQFGCWEVDVARLQASAEPGIKISLTPREIDLLRCFAAHPGIVLDRNRITREAWGIGFSSSRSLDQHLVTLRRKLEANGMPRLIETVYAVGYRYNADTKPH